MYWGQFVTVVGKSEYPCVGCTEPIHKATWHYNLVSKQHVSKRTFTRRFHIECFNGYIDRTATNRQEEIVKKRSEHPGRLPMDLTPELRLQRRRLVGSMSEGRERLAKAYRKGNEKSIGVSKAAIARYLAEMAASQPYKFHLGQEVEEFIRQGKDPVLRASDLLEVDWEDNTEIVELLTRTETRVAPAPVVDTRTPEQQYLDFMAEKAKKRELTNANS